MFEAIGHWLDAKQEIPTGVLVLWMLMHLLVMFHNIRLGCKLEARAALTPEPDTSPNETP